MKHPTAIIFSCDLAVLPVELPHCGEHIVGSDQAWVTLRADRQDQLKKAHDAPFLLCVVLPYPADEVGTPVREKGNLIYSFFNSDGREEG